MTTYNEVAFNILSFLKRNGHNNNETITIPQIVYWINYYYAFFIRDYIKRGDDTLPFEQTLNVPLEIVSTNNSCLNLKFVYKSKIKIPETARLKGKATGIISIINPCSDTQIPLKDYRNLEYVSKGKYFDKNQVLAYLKPDQYLYLENDEFIKTYFNIENNCNCKNEDVICDKCKAKTILPLDNVIINGIFIKPLNIDDVCEGYEVAFNCPLDIVKKITELILKTELTMLLRIPNSQEDLHNLKDGDVKYKE